MDELELLRDFYNEVGEVIGEEEPGDAVAIIEALIQEIGEKLEVAAYAAAHGGRGPRDWSLPVWNG